MTTSNTFIVFLLCTAVCIFAGFDIQHDDGIVGKTRKNGSGCLCHNAQSSSQVSVWLTGPASIRPGSQALYTVHIAGGPAQTGGFNVAAGHGALASGNSDLQLMSGELTHTHPKPFQSDTVSWDFLYQAPASEGMDTIFAAGLSTNNNLTPDHADLWNFSPDFQVLVSSSAPQIVPSVVSFGLIALACLIAVIGTMTLRRDASTPSR